MTVQELTQLVNDKFLFQMTDKNLLMYAEHFATRVAREHWPEVHSVTAEYNDNFDLSLNFVFHTEEDYVWWKLKYG